MYPLGHRVSEMSSTGITNGIDEEDIDATFFCTRASAFNAPRVNLELNMTDRESFFSLCRFSMQQQQQK